MPSFLFSTTWSLQNAIVVAVIYSNGPLKTFGGLELSSIFSCLRNVPPYICFVRPRGCVWSNKIFIASIRFSLTAEAAFKGGEDKVIKLRKYLLETI